MLSHRSAIAQTRERNCKKCETFSKEGLTKWFLTSTITAEGPNFPRKKSKRGTLVLICRTSIPSPIENFYGGPLKSLPNFQAKVDLKWPQNRTSFHEIRQRN